MQCTTLLMFRMCNISASFIFPLNVPIVLLLPLKNGCISMGSFFGYEVCRIWAKLKMSIVTFHKFDHFQCNSLIPLCEFYQIIQFFKYATSIPIYRHMPNLTMRDIDLHELEPSVQRSAGTLYNKYLEYATIYYMCVSGLLRPLVIQVWNIQALFQQTLEIFVMKNANFYSPKMQTLQVLVVPKCGPYKVL